ncbi:MAG: hypothetical protein U1F59_09705 [Candidatus Competibacteraceae bacterium]
MTIEQNERFREAILGMLTEEERESIRKMEPEQRGLFIGALVRKLLIRELPAA